MKYLLILILFASCSKAVGIPGTQKANTVFTSPSLEQQLDGTMLTVTMEPVVTCYSYADGEPQKPCDIFIEVTCTLSNSIAHSVSIELAKIDNDELKTDPVFINIAPNVIEFSFKSSFTNQNNITIPDVFRIEKAIVYDANE